MSVTYAPKPDETLLACSDISLTIEPGEFVTIIGPSGCGKSTLLHCMGGMLPPSEGSVTFAGKQVLKPNPRDAAFVFQDYSLFPWKSVLENAGMGLKFAGGSRQAITQQARRQLDFVGLSQFAERYPRELSGGMQQRVAIARALALEPKVLLMDEPFGALDEQSRRSLGSEMARILADAGQTVVLITHSLDEAVFWADRIIVMSPRPGTIAEEIRLETPRPRDLDFMTTKEFQDIRVHLFEQIQLHR
ncbi:ABC transporter ATP-binding protein [Dactylosporangium sp. NPDC000555]|uniref:ABC transporter ATP-binding protein n=1 Tax=Dactylosporangium sp. NPDC000555 TaxID=3154260 RepID=UPI00331ED4C6